MQKWQKCQIFSIGDFKTEIEKIHEASEFSELLDNYQYYLYKLITGVCY
jgi:hypothetical protein